MHAPRPLALAVVVVASGALASIALTATIRWTVPRLLSGPVGDGTANRRERAAFTTRGFYRPEIDAGTSRQFSWTGPQALVRIPNLDRTQAHHVRFRIAAGRGPATGPPPQLVISVDGVPRLRAESSNEARTFQVDVAPAPSPLATIAINVSSTFVPGPGDARALGVVVEDVSIEPVSSTWRPTMRVRLLVGLVTMLTAAMFAAAGLTPGRTAGATAVVAVGYLWLLTRDGAFLGPYIDRLVNIAAGMAVAGVGVTLLGIRWPHPAIAPEWRVAATVTVVAAAAKLAFFGHPNVALADAIFQVHRAQNVAGGEYFFTSITPRPFFEFPYAIALYVAALPFWDWFPTELDRVRLLRGISLIADAAVGLAMYFALRRTAAGARGALSAAVLWPFARAPVSALCTANLTNLFGQALFGTALVVVFWMAASRSTRPAALAAVVVLLTAGFLSHFSTVSVGVPLAAAVGALLTIRGRDTTRRLGAWTLVLVIVAASVSYAAYYSRFHPVYRATIDRIVSGDGADEARSMAAPARVKAERWVRTLRLEFGWPVLAAAVAGAWWLWRRHREPAVLVLAAWSAGWLLFSLLGILTPIEMRANLAAAPLVTAAAACGVSAIAGASRGGAAVAALVGAAIVWDGLTAWTHCLTG
jgi:hypothetical protein